QAFGKLRRREWHVRSAVGKAAECNTRPPPKNDAIGAWRAYHARSARISSVYKEYGDDRRNCTATPPLPQTCRWRCRGDGSVGFTAAPRVGGVAAFECGDQCHGESAQVCRRRYEGAAAAQTGAGVREMHALLGQARRRLWAVRNLPGLRCQREGLVQRVPGQ